MKQIELTRGKFAVVDDRDFIRLSICKWYCLPTRNICYAARDGSGTTVYMHREIMGAGLGQKIDHKNGDGLDNRREDLRFCTHTENLRNMKKRGYKGVSWHKASRKWGAYICVDGRSKYLGLFVSQKDAAQAYDRAATEYFGEFASTNF